MIAAAQLRLARLWKENSSYALAAGSGVIAPAIGLVAAPILTRLYSPAEFGVLGSFAAILAAALSVANLRYDAAVPLPKSDEEAYSLAMAAIRIGIGASVVITLLFIGFAPVIFDAGMTKALMPNVWWLPIAVILAATTQVLTQFAVRRGAFGELATARLVQGVTGPAVQVAAGVAGIGVVGLLIGQAASQSGGLLRLWRSARAVRENFSSVPPSGPLLKRYERFPRIALLPAFLNAFGLQLPILVIGQMHGLAAAGLIALVLRIMGTPINIFSSAGTQVLLSEGARVRREGGATSQLLKQNLRRQMLVYAPIFAATPLLPWLFPKLFGANWADAGRYAVLLVPALLLGGMMGPSGVMLDVYERQDLHLIREVMRVTILFAAVFAAKFAGGTMWAIVAAVSAAFAINSVIGYAMAWRVSSRAEKHVA
jgi:O-antigen/teichoic acid export membrane protein